MFFRILICLCRHLGFLDLHDIKYAVDRGAKLSFDIVMSALPAFIHISLEEPQSVGGEGTDVRGHSIINTSFLKYFYTAPSNAKLRRVSDIGTRLK